ncbi:YraN family protein [Vibrio hangzhouensis]|uniref:YraN family protein n=1 Tax=Vibrio hangzhouensis TaxID=462991 RepID=UPI001C951DB6|nr:YraN family protein [Vibrio hangzhouensis]MBY6198629.1 YraN family protein [Vibrio hangzhouensis]
MVQLPWNKLTTSKRQVGQDYEQLAKEYLSQHGLVSLTENFTVKCGEVDLIMRDTSCIVFVEVRYRQNQNYGLAQETVTRSKATKLQKAATLWLIKNGLSPYETEFRFDVVAIHRQGNDINWIKNAITQG